MIDRVTICSCTPWHAAAVEQLRAIGPVGSFGRRIDAAYFGCPFGSILVAKARLPDASGTYNYSIDTNPNWLFGGHYEYRDLLDLAAKFWSPSIISSSVRSKKVSSRPKGRATAEAADMEYLLKLRVTRCDLIADLAGSVTQWAGVIGRPDLTASSVSICKGERQEVSLAAGSLLHIVWKSADTTRIVFQDEPRHMLLGGLAAFFDGSFRFCRHAGLVVGDFPYCASDRQLDQKLKSARSPAEWLTCLERLTVEKRRLVAVYGRKDLRQEIDDAFHASWSVSFSRRTDRLLKEARAGLLFEVPEWAK